MKFFEKEKMRLVYEGISSTNMEKHKGRLQRAFETVKGSRYIIGVHATPFLNTYKSDTEEISVTQQAKDLARFVGDMPELTALEFDHAADRLQQIFKRIFDDFSRNKPDSQPDPLLNIYLIHKEPGIEDEQQLPAQEKTPIQSPYLPQETPELLPA